jgi:hypothetical protein
MAFGISQKCPFQDNVYSGNWDSGNRPKRQKQNIIPIKKMNTFFIVQNTFCILRDTFVYEKCLERYKNSKALLKIKRNIKK